MLVLFAPTTPVVALGSWVLGSRELGGWRLAQPGRGWSRRPAMRFRAVGVGTVGSWSAPTRFSDQTDVDPGVYIRAASGWPVRVGGVAPKAPRRATKMSNASSLYRGILARYLAANGIASATPRITALYKADLDGDGTQEIVLEARNSDTLEQLTYKGGLRPSDYSLVLLRAVRGNGVAEVPLAFARRGNSPYGPTNHRLAGIADVDGDGRMEVVLSWDAWESFGGALWRYRAGRATRLLEGGTGH